VTQWPLDWDERKRGKGCPMCAEGRPADNGFGIRIFEGRFSDAYLQRADVGQKGYTVVIWRGRHVADPTELSAEQAIGYFTEVLHVGTAVEGHFRPIKLNLEMLGNSLPHLHTHVIPRYLGDGSPGHPALFMRGEAAPDKKIPEDVIEREARSLRELLHG
jgi:diadenosine tetraphosphate (Ap4A) HIT family hydrolase